MKVDADRCMDDVKFFEDPGSLNEPPVAHVMDAGVMLARRSFDRKPTISVAWGRQQELADTDGLDAMCGIGLKRSGGLKTFEAESAPHDNVELGFDA